MTTSSNDAAERLVELGSTAWLELAEAYLSEHIPLLASDVRFSMCEVFTNAPAHVADDHGRVAWWFEISGANVRVGRGVRDDVDVPVVADYAQVLPTARLVYDLDDPSIVAMLRERAAARRAALGDTAADAFDTLPADVRDCLTGLHNFLAPRTA